MQSKFVFIQESGMNFGPFAEGDFFYIEKSDLGKKAKAKLVEFALLREEKNELKALLFVEAKSSFPRKENEEKFEDFLDAIFEKMVNSFSLFLAARLQRHGQGKLPERMLRLPFAKTNILFVLVIKGQKTEGLPDLRDALLGKFQTFSRLWNLNQPFLLVWNEKIARGKNLVTKAQIRSSGRKKSKETSSARKSKK